MNKLLDPTFLFFAFGVLAGALRSNLEIPSQASRMLSQFLLVALGLKGGFALAKSGLHPEAVKGLLCGLALATTVPALAFLALRRLTGVFDAIGLAASCGSVSAVAFIAATQRLEEAGLTFGGHMSAAMALMETPAIVLAVVAARAVRGNADPASGTGGKGAWHVLRESLTDGTQVLLLGSMAVGWLSGEAGRTALNPMVGDLFKCVLCIFLLDMGLLAARKFMELGGCSWKLVAFMLVAPAVHAGLALLLCRAAGLSPGDGALLMTLAASSSFIAVPAVLRHAVPEANPSVYFGLSLGLNFPLNMTLGIPAWIMLAQRFL